jgi:hypothetical protein
MPTYGRNLGATAEEEDQNIKPTAALGTAAGRPKMVQQGYG